MMRSGLSILLLGTGCLCGCVRGPIIAIAEKDVPLPGVPPPIQPEIPTQSPDPRRQIVTQQQARPVALIKNRVSHTDTGNIAVDARWSPFGAYTRTMLDSVQLQWEKVIMKMKIMPARGGTVSVTFVMNDEGRISSIKRVDSAATENDSAARACMRAITDRASYGRWTDDMKAALGTQQEITFTFFYQ